MSFMGTQEFSGIMPKVDASELPLSAAQEASNVDLTGGNLKAISLDSPYYSLNDGADVLDQIPAGEVVSINKGNAPSPNKTRMITNLRLAIKVYRFVSYLAPDTQLWVSTKYTETVTITNTEYTEYGMRIECSTPAFNAFVQLPGIRYEVTGNLFQFVFTEGSGGPDSTKTFPANAALSPDNAKFPQCYMPYSDAADVVFGHFQTVRCDDPSAPEEFYDPSIANPLGVPRPIPRNGLPTAVTFYVDMNYDVSTRRYTYYVASGYDSEGREGPPSDVTDAQVVRPGEYLYFLYNISAANPYSARVYRSVDSRDGFAAIGDAPSGSFTRIDDTNTTPLGDALPMYGNPKTFNKGNLLHPAGFGVGAILKELYMSDAYRLHAWPEEWKAVFDTNIMAIQLIGASIVVFTEGPGGTDGKVLMLTGSEPQYMGRYEIISTAPMLNKLSMCKIDQSLFYVSNDGLMAVTSNGAENLTKPHYSRAEWMALTPAGYVADVADASIFLTHATSANLRIDLSENLARVSTWTARTNVDGSWKSRKYSFPTPVRFTSGRIISTGYPVNLIIHDEDAGVDYQLDITEAKSTRLPRATRSRNWSFTVEVPKDETIDHVAIAGSTAELALINRVGE